MSLKAFYFHCTAVLICRFHVHASLGYPLCRRADRHVFQVVDVKKNIESSQGANLYPASQLMLIHQGKVLKDDTTLDENNVAENSFVVIMLAKVKCCSH